jgi:hypothetical protein
MTIKEQPFNMKGGGVGGYGFLYWFWIFFSNRWTHFYFFSIAIKLIFFFLQSQNKIFFPNALYKGVSQYSFLDAMLITNIYYKFPCYISHLYM